MNPVSKCRFCAGDLTTEVVDLGGTPLSNAYLEAHQLGREEPIYPLRVLVCGHCFLVQIDAVEAPQNIFRDYAYFSSYSESWLEHSRRFAEHAIERLSLAGDSFVLELASNDGYLLQYFSEAGIPVLGIEPAANVADVARRRGIATECRFFGAAFASELAGRGMTADLIVANNVLAHVPELNDFVAGLPRLLKPRGLVSIEVPHLLRLLNEVQFDTIYHEHFSYFSLLTAESVLAAHGLKVFDVEELSTHGGSVRIWACHRAAAATETQRLHKVRRDEQEAKIDHLRTYVGFGAKVEESRMSIRGFLDEARQQGQTVVGYGAAAKGNTLLNVCGVTDEDVRYVVDRSPYKQGRYLPGTHLEILPPQRVGETKPDYLLILPWNLRDEIMEQMGHIREWGGRFVTPLPDVKIYS